MFQKLFLVAVFLHSVLGDPGIVLLQAAARKLHSQAPPSQQRRSLPAKGVEDGDEPDKEMKELERELEAELLDWVAALEDQPLAKETQTEHEDEQTGEEEEQHQEDEVNSNSGRPQQIIREEFPWPAFFLHVPKTGGNFATTVMHTACSQCTKEGQSLVIGGMFTPPTCCSSKFNRFDSEHLPLYAADYERLPEPRHKHVITMFRDPRQRLLSGFYHNRHDCGYLKTAEAPNCSGDDITLTPCHPLSQPATPEKLEAYAECAGMCFYKMLTAQVNASSNRHDFCGRETKNMDEHDTVNNVNVDLSAHEMSSVLSEVSDVIDEMGFVGLTDEYELSVCLWHARYGTPCLPVEFSNLRAGSSRGDGRHDESAITSKVEKLLTADQKIYEKARSRFYADLRKYSITRGRCAEICPEPAEVWSVNATSQQLLELSTDEFHLNWPGRLAFFEAP